MRKPVLVGAALVLGCVSVALAGKPKPMACDAWACKGASCAPAKYAEVRSAPTIVPLFSSPLYGAAVLEGGAGFALFLLASTVSRRRRSSAREDVVAAPTSPESTDP
jgi:hypothetical protein